ncbi:MAG: spore coat associated protein CotJA [Clostridia bacterium]|nr:spore coat associated protein CotJA [Clostridia bacterium]
MLGETPTRRPVRGATRGGETGTGRGCGGNGGTGGAAFVLPELYGAPLAMVYSPVQRFEDLYDPEEGLQRGTIFRALDLPFYPTGCGAQCAGRR